MYIRLEWVFDTYGELLQLWCHPQDLDEFDHALEELSQCMLGKVRQFLQTLHNLI